MNCETALQLIDAFMDSELDPSTSLEVSTHLSACPACKQALESRQALSKAIKLAAAFAPAPAALRGQIRHKIQPRPHFRYGIAALGMAAVVAACFGFATWKKNSDLRRDQDQVISDVMAHYQASESSAHIVDIRSKECGSLKNWFNSKVNWSPKVYRLFSQPFTMVGGRVDLVGNQAAPVIVYRSGNSNVDVFVTPSVDVKPRNVDAQGLHVRSWSDSGHDYYAVSNGTPAEINAVQSALKVCR